MRTIVIYLAAVVCLALAIAEVVSLCGVTVGFTRESWRTIGSVGYHRNDGAVFSPRGVMIFFEREEHPNGPSWWGQDRTSWDGAGAPPQFTVAPKRRVHDWRLFGSGYLYSEREVPESWQGQYDLLVVNPLLLLAACGAVVALAVRHAWRRRRYPPGRCQQCGYDLRGAAHERCPECGAAAVAAADHSMMSDGIT